MNKKTDDNYIDESILSTPKPRASSTVSKEQKFARNTFHKPLPINLDINNSSLGILSLTSVDMSNDFLNSKEGKNIKKSADINSKLLHERTLANEQLKIRTRFNKSFLLEPGEELPRSKKPSSSRKQDDARGSTKSINSMFYKQMSEMSKSLRSGNDSIKDLCEQFDISSLSQSISLNNEEFVPAENMQEKLYADELSWRNQFDTMPKDKTEFSQLSSCNAENISIGKYFLAKCQNLSELSLETSQITPRSPIKLLDSTYLSDCPEKDTKVTSFTTSAKKQNVSESIVSISQIQNLMNDICTPERCIERLLKKQHQENEQINLSNCSFLPQINSTLSDGSDSNEISLRSNDFANSDKENEPQQRSYSCNSNTSTEYQNTEDKSIITTRSGSSMNTFPDGKLPIQVSKFELIWGTVKIGKQNVQQLIVKNKSQKRIYFVMRIEGNNFRIIQDQLGSDLVTSLNVLMHPLETKSFKISFSPIKLGASVEKLTFKPGSNNTQTDIKNLSLKLYGYGGHINLNFEGPYKDVTNCMWLCLGKLDNQIYLTKEVIIRNLGNLPAFAMLSIATKDIPFLSRPQITTSSNIVIPPKGSSKVAISFTATKENIHYLNSLQMDVVQVSALKIICGSEIVRGRIRRLYNKLLKNSSTVESIVLKLCTTFTNEQMPNDLIKFTETVGAMDDLLKQLTEKEILLTLEQNLENTIIANLNESTMFQSLIENETVLENTVIFAPPNNIYNIEPRNIILTPPIKCEDTILISCNQNKQINFNARVDSSSTLEVFPCEGVVNPGDTFVLRIRCNKKLSDNDNFNVFISVDSDVIEVIVKVVCLKK